MILTIALPEALQRRADAVRNSHAPAASARAPAHLSLFRHLPGPALADIGNSLRRIGAAPAPALRVAAPAAWDRRWVAPVSAPALEALRADLADHWYGLLAPGDLAPPRLHISLSGGRERPPPLDEGPWMARGLLLWRHDGASNRHPERDGAFWTPLVAFAFHG